MSTKETSLNILLIGASGYIGGTILHALSLNDSFRVTTLTRKESSANAITASYPNVRTLIGSLADQSTLRSAATTADVVVYAARNTQDGIVSILEGLAARRDVHSRNNKTELQRTSALFIMISAIISTSDPADMGRLGEAPPETVQVLSDVSDVAAIMHLPDHHWHVGQERNFYRLTDQYGDGAIIPIIMSLPFMVGTGTGPVNRINFLHDFVSAVLHYKDHRPFTLGPGRNMWNWASPRDIAAAVTCTLHEWVKDRGNIEMRGYYFVEAGQFEIGDLARHVGRLLASDECSVEVECEILEYTEFAKLLPDLPGLWGVNALGRGDRLRSLGWKPEITSWQPLVEDCMTYVLGDKR